MTFCKRPLKGNPVFPPGFFNANDVSFCVGMVNSTEFGIWAELRSRGIFSPNYLGFLVVLVLFLQAASVKSTLKKFGIGLNIMYKSERERERQKNKNGHTIFNK